MLSFKETSILLETYDKISGRLGSNPGGIFQHKETGEKSYIKFPVNPDQARTEVATAKIYHHMGIKTLNPKLENVNGKLGVKTEWNGELENLGNPNTQTFGPDRASQLATIHHAAIITGNQDIAGLEYDNLMKHNKSNDIYSADQGGSMNFRAQGAEKPFEANIDLFHSFKNPKYTSGNVFGKAQKEYPNSHKDAIIHLQNLKDEHIDSAISDVGLHPAISDIIKKRRDLLINHLQKT